jgi:hypothetical protein
MNHRDPHIPDRATQHAREIRSVIKFRKNLGLGG